MYRLAVFDIDGTLTDTNAVDDACFRRAIGETLDIDATSVDWSQAPDVTDSALLAWLAERYERLPLSERTAGVVLDCFLELLEAERVRAPLQYRLIAGAEQLFAALARAGWTCALATGGWEQSARLKLDAAGLEASTLPLASSSDASTRVEIMQIAASLARANGDAFERIVSVGDALWDLRAAAELHWPFIGIAVGSAAVTLRNQGATTILPDFSDLAAVLAALAQAEPPRLASVAPVV
jgi:phosphoglycolate phosphatase-like HAD superfamily hydrolase